MNTETAGEREALLPCPFCGCDLVPNTNQADMMVRRYGTHYDHPQSLCHLSEHEVRPIEVEDWNLRAAPPIAPVELPPLPEPAGAIEVDLGPAGPEYMDGARLQKSADGYSVEQMRAYAIAAKAQAPAEPAGWKLVPIEPTPEMNHSGRYGGSDGRPLLGEDPVLGTTEWPIACNWTARQIYRAMLAAAPKAPAENTSANPWESETFEAWFTKRWPDFNLNSYGRSVLRRAAAALEEIGAAGKAPAQPAPPAPPVEANPDTKRLDHLEAMTDRGLAPKLVFDDNGNWAVAYDGCQPAGPFLDETVDILVIVQPDKWRWSVREAIDADMAISAAEALGSDQQEKTAEK